MARMTGMDTEGECGGQRAESRGRRAEARGGNGESSGMGGGRADIRSSRGVSASTKSRNTKRFSPTRIDADEREKQAGFALRHSQHMLEVQREVADGVQ